MDLDPDHWQLVALLCTWRQRSGGPCPAVVNKRYSKVVKDDFETEYYAYDPENSGKRTTVTKIELVYNDDESDPLVTINCLEFPGVIDRVLPCNDEEHNFVFVTKRPTGIVHSNFGHFYRRAVGEDVASVVQMYPVPLSIKFIGSSDTTFSFGSKNTKCAGSVSSRRVTAALLRRSKRSSDRRRLIYGNNLIIE